MTIIYKNIILITLPPPFNIIYKLPGIISFRIISLRIIVRSSPLQRNTVADGLFTLRRNQRFMTILKLPFKSLPAINDSKNGIIRANSEGPKADKNSPPVVCVTFYSCDI